MTEALKKRIAALREMTVSRGCTEAEASRPPPRQQS